MQPSLKSVYLMFRFFQPLITIQTIWHLAELSSWNNNPGKMSHYFIFPKHKNNWNAVCEKKSSQLATVSNFKSKDREIFLLLDFLHSKSLVLFFLAVIHCPITWYFMTISIFLILSLSPSPNRWTFLGRQFLLFLYISQKAWNSIRYVI